MDKQWDYTLVIDILSLPLEYNKATYWKFFFFLLCYTILFIKSEIVASFFFMFDILMMRLF